MSYDRSVMLHQGSVMLPFLFAVLVDVVTVTELPERVR